MSSYISITFSRLDISSTETPIDIPAPTLLSIPYLLPPTSYLLPPTSYLLPFATAYAENQPPGRKPAAPGIFGLKRETHATLASSASSRASACAENARPPSRSSCIAAPRLHILPSTCDFSQDRRSEVNATDPNRKPRASQSPTSSVESEETLPSWSK